ncbi:REEP1 [Bugula neritina]|uniref:Receptor expression-enhancing protein n=1 Tax=Bugula neritina TaxID=10212 RepID=A0A7J7K2L8_BUGNE|nr:REEP1 [Bugula neritina]
MVELVDCHLIFIRVDNKYYSLLSSWHNLLACLTSSADKSEQWFQESYLVSLSYASYKAVKTKNVKEYVKWMMYWIVFALFTTVETFADVLISCQCRSTGSQLCCPECCNCEYYFRVKYIPRSAEFVSWGVFLCFSCTARWFQIANRDSCFTENSGLQLNDDDLKGQNRMMDHLMKKSFSMGDISKQQGNAAPVTYKPIDLIEEVDEPDYGAQPHDVQGPSDNYQPLQEGGVPGAGKNYFILNLSKLPVSCESLFRKALNAIC